MEFATSEELAEFLGNNIRSILKKRRMTIQDLAYKIDIERPNLSNIINGNIGNPTIWTYYQIARGLGISPAELFFLSDDSEE